MFGVLTVGYRKKVFSHLIIFMLLAHGGLILAVKQMPYTITKITLSFTISDNFQVIYGNTNH